MNLCGRQVINETSDGSTYIHVGACSFRTGQKGGGKKTTASSQMNISLTLKVTLTKRFKSYRKSEKKHSDDLFYFHIVHSTQIRFSPSPTEIKSAVIGAGNPTNHSA